MYCCGNSTCGKCGDGENARTSAKMVRTENTEKKESHVLLR